MGLMSCSFIRRRAELFVHPSTIRPSGRYCLPIIFSFKDRKVWVRVDISLLRKAECHVYKAKLDQYIGGERCAGGPGVIQHLDPPAPRTKFGRFEISLG